jgi:hypothetical protein
LRPPRRGEPSTTREPKRRKLRRKETRSAAKGWEIARHNAWLWELLTDSLGDESGDEYTRFPESRRWITEMTGNRSRGDHELMEDGARGETTTTARGKCSGPCEAGVAMSS